MAARPDWWTPEAVLGRLEGGERPMALCKKVQYETGASFRTVYNDLTLWRKTVEGFEARYRAAVNWSLGAGGTKTAPPGWEVLWLKAWEATGQPVKACDMVEEETGFRPSYLTIRDKKNPNHHSYDERFAKEYARVEEEVLGRRVDDIFEAVQDPTTSARDRAFIDLQILERRRPDEWSRLTKHRHEGTVEHTHRHQLEGIGRRFHELVDGRFERHLPVPAKTIEAGAPPPSTPAKGTPERAAMEGVEVERL